jgi:type VI secretion system protein ImpB
VSDIENNRMIDSADARPPRVQIRYPIETGDAVELREMPFVVGVLADLSGDGDYSLYTSLKDRKFIELDRDNFDTVMNTIAPQLRFKVPVTLPVGVAGVTSPDLLLTVELRFRAIDDFAPDSIALQVKPLADLLALRASLADLANVVNGSDRLDAAIQDALNDTERRSRVAKEIQEASDSGSSANQSIPELEAVADAGRLGYSLEERQRGLAWLRLFFD